MPSAIRVPALRVKEVDGAPDVLGVETITVTNGTLTDSGGGAVILATGAGGSLTVTEEDNNPSVANVSEIRVTNGTLTDNTGGSVSISIAGGSLTVEEIDGNPSVANVTEIKVSNGTLTDNTGGSVTIVTSPTALVSDRVILTGGNFTTSSTSFVDVTSATVTMTTGAHRCLVVVTGSYNHVTTDACLEIDIDGAVQGGTHGLNILAPTGAAVDGSASFSYLTAALTAASHTFKLQARVVTGNTLTLFAGAACPLVFGVFELGNT